MRNTDHSIVLADENDASPALTLELEPVAFLRLAGGTASPQRLLIWTASSSCTATSCWPWPCPRRLGCQRAARDRASAELRDHQVRTL